MSKYRQINNGDTVAIEKAGFMRFRCCDCGLVHNIVNTNYKRGTNLTFFRDNRRTGQIRRHKKPLLMQHIDLVESRLRQSNLILKNLMSDHPELFPEKAARSEQITKNLKAIGAWRKPKTKNTRK